MDIQQDGSTRMWETCSDKGPELSVDRKSSRHNFVSICR
jgi:hypothetical protein